MMFAGHFGLAAGVKAKVPEVPLWALMVATQLIDVVFVPLLLTGVESFDESIGTGYGKMIIHADYSHSLVGAGVLALLAGWLAKRLWGVRAGRVIAGVVFSHWVLDLLVHRPDLPLLPGNFGNLPLMGLGLWRLPGLAIGTELLLITVGLILYSRSLWKQSGQGPKGRAVLSSAVLGILLLLALVADVMG